MNSRYSSRLTCMHRVYSAGLNLLSPPACAYCQEFLDKRAVLCASCMNKLQPVVSLILPVTKTKSIKIFAVAAYKEPIKSLILAKAWSDSAASRQLGELIWQKTYFRYCVADYLVPIPLHWMRAAWRGFNQASEIAQVLAQKSGCNVVNVLKRVKRTHFQSALSPVQRSDNLDDAFALATMNAERFVGKHLVLVDDLMTTGATLREAAKLLYQLKPASVSAVVAARAI